MTSPSIVAIIPALNEEKAIGSVVTALKPLVSVVVVVDDFSTDNTATAAEAAGAFVVRHESRRGYDGSIEDGFKTNAARKADIFLTLDGDGEHHTNDVSRVLAPILENHADIVVAQRPHIRHWSEGLFALYTRLRFGVRDPLCGLKAYRRNVYDAVGHFDSMNSIGTELMIRGIRKGFRIALVPITLHARRDGSSRFYVKNIRGNIKILQALFRVLSIKDEI